MPLVTLIKYTCYLLLTLIVIFLNIIAKTSVIDILYTIYFILVNIVKLFDIILISTVLLIHQIFEFLL